jgi:hypothetical protein
MASNIGGHLPTRLRHTGGQPNGRELNYTTQDGIVYSPYFNVDLRYLASFAPTHRVRVSTVLLLREVISTGVIVRWMPTIFRVSLGIR